MWQKRVQASCHDALIYVKPDVLVVRSSLVAGGAGVLVLLIVAGASAVVMGRRRAQHRGYAQGVNDATREPAVAKPPPAANAVDDII